MEFSRCTPALRVRPNEKAAPGAVSQNSAVLVHRARRNSRRARNRTGRVASNGRVAHRSNCSGIPRKEATQPQLPLRLPCYDFPPVTNPPFGGSLPCGLGHRLRVLPAFVVGRAVCTRPENVFTAALLIRDY